MRGGCFCGRNQRGQACFAWGKGGESGGGNPRVKGKKKTRGSWSVAVFEKEKLTVSRWGRKRGRVEKKKVMKGFLRGDLLHWGRGMDHYRGGTGKKRGEGKSSLAR